MSDHDHSSYDVHGVAEEHHRHYDLERDIESGKDREIGADKVYVSGTGYLDEIIANLRAELDALKAAFAEAVKYAEREPQR